MRPEPAGWGRLRLTPEGWRTAAADGRRVGTVASTARGVAGAAAHEWRGARTWRARAMVGVTRAVEKVFQLAFLWWRSMVRAALNRMVSAVSTRSKVMV